MAVPEEHNAVDLACEGGGVKGIGLAESWNFERSLTEFRGGKEHHRREAIGAELQQTAVA